MRMRTFSAGNEDGYTLTELLVVLAVLMLVISLTPPLYRIAVPSARLKSTEVELGSFLRKARSDAERSGQTVELAVSPRQIVATGKEESVFEVPEHMALSFQPAFPDSASDGSLLFFAEGGSSGGKVVLSAAGDHRGVLIHWLTGHIAVER